MSALKNIRHEAFAQRLVEATKTKRTNGEAYHLAGYKAAGEAAEACAARLLGDAKAGVAKRVHEILEQAAKRVGATVENLLGELDEVRTRAIDAEQFGAARGAIDSKARLKGLFVDKLEVGSPGEFAQCQSPTEVVDALLAMASPGEAADALNALATLLEARAGHAARDVTPVPRRIGSTFEQKWPGRRR